MKTYSDEFSDFDDTHDEEENLDDCKFKCYDDEWYDDFESDVQDDVCGFDMSETTYDGDCW